jgi:hypothetical protein
LETSAKSGQNVQEAFHDLARRLIIAQSGDTSVKNGLSAVVDLKNEATTSGWYPSSCCGQSYF